MNKIRTWLTNRVTRSQLRAERDEAQAAVARVRAESARIRAVTRTWEPVANLIDAALDGPTGGQQEQYAPVDWQAIVERRERELKTVGEARHQAETRIKQALEVIHEWQRNGPSNDYLTRVHRALNPPVSGDSAGPARP